MFPITAVWLRIAQAVHGHIFIDRIYSITFCLFCSEYLLYYFHVLQVLLCVVAVFVDVFVFVIVVAFPWLSSPALQYSVLNL